VQWELVWEVLHCLGTGLDQAQNGDLLRCRRVQEIYGRRLQAQLLLLLTLELTTIAEINEINYIQLPSYACTYR